MSSEAKVTVKRRRRKSTTRFSTRRGTKKAAAAERKTNKRQKKMLEKVDKQSEPQKEEKKKKQCRRRMEPGADPNDEESVIHGGSSEEDEDVPPTCKEDKDALEKKRQEDDTMRKTVEDDVAKRAEEDKRSAMTGCAIVSKAVAAAMRKNRADSQKLTEVAEEKAATVENTKTEDLVAKCVEESGNQMREVHRHYALSYRSMYDGQLIWLMNRIGKREMDNAKERGVDVEVRSHSPINPVGAPVEPPIVAYERAISEDGVSAAPIPLE